MKKRIFGYFCTCCSFQPFVTELLSYEVGEGWLWFFFMKHEKGAFAITLSCRIIHRKCNNIYKSPGCFYVVWHQVKWIQFCWIDFISNQSMQNKNDCCEREYLVSFLLCSSSLKKCKYLNNHPFDLLNYANWCLHQKCNRIVDGLRRIE